MPKLNWRKWKMGILVAGATGFCTALVTGAVVPEMGWRAFFFVIAVNMAKDIGLYLQKNPEPDVVGASNGHSKKRDDL